MPIVPPFFSNKFRKIFGVLMITMACLTIGDVSGEIESVTLGPKDNAVIVHGKEAAGPEILAAQELQRFIKMMTGIEVPIRDDSGKETGLVFSVGRTKYAQPGSVRFDSNISGPGKDSFVLNVQPGRITLLGGGFRGTLYSVYALLEEQGCRWFMPGDLGQVIPKKKTLTFPVGQRFESPDFILREICDTGAENNTQARNTIDWCVRNRINRNYSLIDGHRQYWAFRGGFPLWNHICHTYPHILPNEKYFKDHPEYFSLYNGKRIKCGDGEGNVCTTNPDVIRIFAQAAIDWFDQHPNSPVFTINSPDGDVKWCECENCKKLGGENGRLRVDSTFTRRHIEFSNAVARIVGKKYPDRRINILAYHLYAKPVPNLKLEPNIMVTVSHLYDGCRVHGLGTCKKNTPSSDRQAHWGKLAPDKMGIWDYFLLQAAVEGGDMRAPMPLVQTAYDTIQFIYKHGGRYYFTQVGSDPWRYNPLPYYIIAKMTWDVHADLDAICDDFYDKFYSCAAKPMKQYYQLLEKAVQQADWHPTDWRHITCPSPNVFTNKVLKNCEKALCEAEKLAEKDSKTVRQRIALVRISFDFTRMFVTTQKIFGVGVKGIHIQRNANSVKLNAKGKKLDDKTEARILKKAEADGFKSESLKRLMFRCRKRTLPIITIENDRVSIGVLPDIGGRIIRMCDKKSDFDFVSPGPDVIPLTELGNAYIVYGGYEEYVGKDLGSPGWETPFKYTLKKDPKRNTIQLSANVEGFSLERTIWVDKGNSPQVHILSELTNNTDKPINIVLRSHPLLKVGSKDDDVVLFAKTDDGRVLQGKTLGEFPDPPAGLWAVADSKTDRGVLHFFDPTYAWPFFYKDQSSPSLTMELFTKPLTLGVGESLKLKQIFQVSKQVTKDIKKRYQKVKTEIPSKHEVIKNILMIGNSLTRHEPRPKLLGWHGNWGMAATTEEKDFVHILYKYISSSQPQHKPGLKIMNLIATNNPELLYRRGLRLAATKQFQSLKGHKADLVVVQIGDNLDDKDATYERFGKPYEQLLAVLKKEGDPLIFCTSLWRVSPVMEKQIKEACKKEGATYIDISHIAADPKNSAGSEGHFQDSGVNQHPGDQGMKAIADHLWSVIMLKLVQGDQVSE